VWTTAHNVTAEKDSSKNSFLLTVDDAAPGDTLRGLFLGSAGSQTKMYKASFSPFAGWQVVNERVMPAPAIVVEQPGADAWSAAIWSLAESGRTGEQIPSSARMAQWRSPQDWTLALALGKAELEIRRQGDRMSINNDGNSQTLGLAAGPDVTQRYQQLRDAFQQALAKYPKFDDHFRYRVRATQLLLGLLLIQELALLFIRLKRKIYYKTFRIVSTAAWSAGGLVLIVFFDRWVDALSEIHLLI
jgi:hypothetical protein